MVNSRFIEKVTVFVRFSNTGMVLISTFLWSNICSKEFIIESLSGMENQGLRYGTSLFLKHHTDKGTRTKSEALRVIRQDIPNTPHESNFL